MKKYFYFLLMVSVPCRLFAQPTIYNMENNPIGMVAKFVQVSTTGISAGGAGSTSWNMTSLTHLGTANDTFYESTIANTGTAAPSATRIDSFTSTSNFGGKHYINQSGGNTYFLNDSVNTTADYYYTVPANGLLIAKQPIHYMDSYTDTFNYTYISSTPTITVNGYYTVNVDAYGTLTLPTATYNNVLRVHITEIDTAHDGSGAHLSTQNTYAWYDDHHSVPLCKIVYDTFSSGNSMKAYYMLSQTPLVKVENVNYGHQDFSACFSGTNLYLNSNFEQGHSYSLSIFDLSAHLVYSNSFSPPGKGGIRLNTDTWLAPGIYTLVLTDKNTRSFSVLKVPKQ